jgi:hypothetical protein
VILDCLLETLILRVRVLGIAVQEGLLSTPNPKYSALNMQQGGTDYQLYRASWYGCQVVISSN